MNNKIYKTVLYRHYNLPKGCDKGDKCVFAHGEKDLRKKKCDSYDKCWNEDCYLNFSHPPEWNAYDNKERCLICEKGYCNKLNKRFKHIIDNYKFDIVKDDKNNKMDIPKNSDFPDLIKTNKQNNNKDNKYKYSEILTSNLKNKLNIKDNKIMNDEYNSENDIKKQLKDNYILLSKLNPKDWVDIDDYYDTKEKIENLKSQYKKNTNIYEKNEVFDDNLDLNTLFNGNEERFIPNISFTINGFEVNNESILNISKSSDDLKKEERINKINDNVFLTRKMEEEIKIFNEEIKKNINRIIKDNHVKYIFLNNLNKITSMITLFKDNYEDYKN